METEALVERAGKPWALRMPGPCCCFRWLPATGLGLGWFRDLFCLPRYVAQANEEHKVMSEMKQAMEQSAKPRNAWISSRSTRKR